jgi:signal transduction histidine kinase
VLSPPSLLMDCDAELLRRAIDNLLDNAIRYSPPEARVTLRAATEGAQLVLQVEDDGPGISPEVREALFHVFTRGDSLEDDLGHHGLGLAFVDLVARQHSGSVSVECPSHGGSVFTLRLPLKTPDLKVLPRPSNVEPSAPS